MNGPVPRFPTVVVTMAADGSAHLNSAGTHEHYPAGDPAATRAAITHYVAGIAAGLHRSVRLTVHDPASTWLLAVTPDAVVSQLESPVAKKGRPAAAPDLVPASPAPAPTIRVEPPRPTAPAAPVANPWSPPALLPEAVPAPMPAPVLLEESTVFVPRAARAAARISIAVDGEPPFTVDTTALVGRNPVPAAGEQVGQLVKLADPGKTTSKTHLLLERRGDRLWMTDRGSANGSRLTRAAGDLQQLTAGIAFELVDGDSVDLGGQTLTVHITAV